MRGLILAVFGSLVLGGAAHADKFKNPTAVFSGLDKITGRIISFEAAVDETVQFGSLQLTARVCYSSAEDANPRTTTFLEVDEVGSDNRYRRLFTGWMFAQSPGLNAIEHPVYDVWLSECKGAKPSDKIITGPEYDEEPPPPVTEPRKAPPRPVTATRPGAPGAANAPLRLPGADGLPPGNVQPRAAPQQRFFPTNTGPGGVFRDPANSNR